MALESEDKRAKIYREGKLVHPTLFEMTHTLVAYRFCDTDGRVICPKCALKYDLVAEGSIALYPIHLIPYSQKCHDCNGPIIAEGWDSQLYEQPPCRTCNGAREIRVPGGHGDYDNVSCPCCNQ